MPNAGDLAPESRFTALFLGPSGSGKKGAACTFPGPIKYLDFDGRIRGLLGCDWVDRKQIDYTYYPPLSGQSGGKTVFERVNADMAQFYNSWVLRQCKYKTIVMGSITGSADGLLNDSIPLTHGGRNGGGDSGKTLGPLKMPGPEDWGFQSVGTKQLLNFFKSMDLNVIVLGHIVPTYGKDPENPYGDSIQNGEKLALTDKLSAVIPGVFDNIFKFEKQSAGAKGIRYMVEFRGLLARTIYRGLPDSADITRKNFYQTMMESALKDVVPNPDVKKVL